MMSRSLLIFIAMSSIAFGHPAQAEEESGEWQGEVELGYVQTSGNTKTSSVNTRFQLKHEQERWRQKLDMAALRSSDGGQTTAEQFSSLFRAEYKLTEIDYLFGSLRYQDDRFAGYDRRTTEVFGYGRTVVHTEKHNLSLETGVGARQTENTDGTGDDEAVIRVALNYAWKISEHSSFKESLSVEKGDDNTVSESVTELKLKINSALSMKLTVSVKDNSDVPVDTKHTDVQSAVTLVYDF